MNKKLPYFFNSLNSRKITFKVFQNVDDFCGNYIFRNKSLKAIHINVRSIKKHWLTLMAYLNEFIDELDVITLTEIKTTENEVTVFQINNFELYARCRPNGRGGGIAVYVRNCYNVDRQFYDIEQSEHLCLKLTHMSYPFEVVLSCIYRPPDHNVNMFLEELDLFLNNDCIKKQKLIMLGDVNICTKTAAKHSSKYLNLLFSNGLVNTIFDFTREEIAAGELQTSCVDHINVRTSKANKFDSFLIRNKVADHYFVGCSMSLVPNNEHISQLKNTKQNKTIISQKKVKEEIDKHDWSKFIEISNGDDFYLQLKNDFEEIYKNSQMEIKSNKLDLIKPWINSKIKILIKEKETLFNRWKVDKRNEDLKKQYKIVRNKLTSAVRKEYNKYYLKKFEESSGDTNKIWSLSDELIGKKKKKSTVELLRKHFSHVLDLNVLCEEFNKNFLSQVESVKQSNKGPSFNLQSTEYVPSTNNKSLYWPKISMSELNDAVNKIKCTSPGIDGIRLVDIKNNFQSLSNVLLSFFNLLFESGNIPDGLKISVITPLHKKGRKSDVQNYRPIGTVPALAKI